jgi:hemerythrin
MALLWRNQFSVGNDLIDSDHQYLLEIINRAEVCLKANDAVALNSVLDELAHYGRSHFEREELIAKAVGYTNADGLHASHAELLEDLTKFHEQLGSNLTQPNIEKLIAFLRDWLIQHVIKEDMLMKPWLTKHSPRFDPRQKLI